MTNEPVKWVCSCGQVRYAHPGGKMVCMSCFRQMFTEQSTDDILQMMKRKNASPSEQEPPQ